MAAKFVLENDHRDVMLTRVDDLLLIIDASGFKATVFSRCFLQQAFSNFFFGTYKFKSTHIMKYYLWLLFCLFFVPGLAQPGWQKISEELVLTDPPFDQCHASTLVEAGPGNLMVAFFGGSEEGNKDVAIWLASAMNNKWAAPTKIAEGVINDSLRFPCWNPVLFKNSEGKVFLFYKIGPSPATWWGMVSTSGDNGKTWRRPDQLPPGILGPIKNKPIQLTDGSIISPSSNEDKDQWKVFIERSGDQGKTWKTVAVDPNSTYKVIQPSILTYPNGRMQIICRSDQDKIVQAWSGDKGETWGLFSKLDLSNPNSGIDAVTLKSGQQLLVYNPGIRGKEWFNNRGKLHVAVSNNGLQWKDIIVLENSEKDEFSYPAVIQSVDGRVHITYTYKRTNIKHVVLVEKHN
ncbi:MAG: sialidase family protein [Ferruginibacter sp.]